MKPRHPIALVWLALVVCSAPAFAQDESFHRLRRRLRKEYREASSPEEKRSILAQLERLEFRPEAEPRRHVVVSGDTLSAIALAYGVSLADLLAANPGITNPNLIHPGDEIVIPGPGGSTGTAEPEPEIKPESESSPAPPAEPAGPVGSKAAAALEWSADQMPGGSGTGVNSNNGLSIAESDHAWDSWCLAFVATAYGRSVEELRAADAITSYYKFFDAGKIVDSRSDLPPGAPVFFDATKSNGYYGHVAIFTGRYTADGDPIIRTSGWTRWPGIHEISLSDLEAKCGSLYLGYGVIDEE